MAASFPRVTVLIFLEVVFSGMYLSRLLDIIRFDLVCEDNWYWYHKYLTMENDGSFVPQGYGVDISWSSIFRDVFVDRLLDTIRFDLVCEDNWYWYDKYLTMENDGSFVPQGYGVDISMKYYFPRCYLSDRLLDTIRFDLVCEEYWYWYYKYLTMENDGSFVPQAYGVDISWSIIFRCVFVRLLDIIRFDLVCDDYWYWYYKYLTMENDGSFVPQGYGVDISWSSIFRNLFSIDFLI